MSDMEVTLPTTGDMEVTPPATVYMEVICCLRTQMNGFLDG